MRVTFCLHTLASSASTKKLPEGSFLPLAEQAMPQANRVSLRWFISMILSLMCEALATPLYSAMDAAAPMATSPLPTLQPP